MTDVRHIKHAQLTRHFSSSQEGLTMDCCVETTNTEELVLDISFKRLLWVWLQFPSSPTSFLFIAKLQKNKDKVAEEKESPT